MGSPQIVIPPVLPPVIVVGRKKFLDMTTASPAETVETAEIAGTQGS